MKISGVPEVCYKWYPYGMCHGNRIESRAG